MIVRLLTATLKADQAGVFNELMRTQLPLLRDHPGLRYANVIDLRVAHYEALDIDPEADDD